MSSNNIRKRGENSTTTASSTATSTTTGRLYPSTLSLSSSPLPCLTSAETPDSNFDNENAIAHNFTFDSPPKKKQQEGNKSYFFFSSSTTNANQPGNDSNNTNAHHNEDDCLLPHHYSSTSHSSTATKRMSRAVRNMKNSLTTPVKSSSSLANNHNDWKYGGKKSKTRYYYNNGNVKIVIAIFITIILSSAMLQSYHRRQSDRNKGATTSRKLEEGQMLKEPKQEQQNKIIKEESIIDNNDENNSKTTPRKKATLSPSLSSTTGTINNSGPFAFRPHPQEDVGQEQYESVTKDINFFRNAYYNATNDNKKNALINVIDNDEQIGNGIDDLNREVIGFESNSADYNRFDDPLNFGTIFVIYTATSEAGSNNTDDITTPGTELYEELSNHALNFETHIQNEFHTYHPDDNGSLLSVEVMSYYSLMLGSLSTIISPNRYIPDRTVVHDKLQHLAQTQFKSVVNHNHATKHGGNRHSILIEIRYSFATKSKHLADNMNKHFLDTIREVSNMPIMKQEQQSEGNKLSVMYTGLPILQEEMQNVQNNNVNNNKCIETISSIFNDSSLESIRAYNYFSQHFGYSSPLIGSWGRLSPYHIVFRMKNGESIDSDDGFRLMNKVIQEFIQLDMTLESIKQQELEVDEATIPGINIVNLDSIPQRMDNDPQLSLDDLMNNIMNEIYYYNGEEDIRSKEERIENGNQNTNEEEDMLLQPIQKRRNKDQDDDEDESLLLNPITRTMYDGISYIRNNPVPFPIYYGSNKCETNMHGHCRIELFHILGHYYKKRFLSYDKSTTYVQAILGVNPFSLDGVQWLINGRKLINKLKDSGIINTNLYDVTITGGATIEFDYYCSNNVEEDVLSLFKDNNEDEDL